MDPTRSHAQRRRSGSKCASSLSIAFDRVRAFKQANYVPWIRMNRLLVSQGWGLHEPMLGLHVGFCVRITTSNKRSSSPHTAPLAREPECPSSPGTLPGKPVQGWTSCPEFPCHSHLMVRICGNGLLLSYCIAKGSSLCTTNCFDQFIGRQFCHEQATLQPFDHKCGGRPLAYRPDGHSGWILVQHW